MQITRMFSIATRASRARPVRKFCPRFWSRPSGVLMLTLKPTNMSPAKAAAAPRAREQVAPPGGVVAGHRGLLTAAAASRVREGRGRTGARRPGRETMARKTLTPCSRFPSLATASPCPQSSAGAKATGLRPGVARLAARHAGDGGAAARSLIVLRTWLMASLGIPGVCLLQRTRRPAASAAEVPARASAAGSTPVPAWHQRASLDTGDHDTGHISTWRHDRSSAPP